MLKAFPRILLLNLWLSPCRFGLLVGVLIVILPRSLIVGADEVDIAYRVETL